MNTIYAVHTGCYHEGLGLSSLHLTLDGAMAKAKEFVTEYDNDSKRIFEDMPDQIKVMEVQTKLGENQCFWADNGIDAVCVYSETIHP